ncbi:MAG: hypothetical protein IKA43_03795 [Clostridia bacterium]|nr:hypothetical protein [Clostridia bacterium]
MDENMNEELTIIDMLLDDEIEELTLLDEKGNEIKFYNYGIIIPYTVNDEARIYTILEPVDKVDGVEEGEGLVFRVYTVEADGEDNIETEDDMEIVEGVFAEYQRLFNED